MKYIVWGLVLLPLILSLIVLVLYWIMRVTGRTRNGRPKRVVVKGEKTFQQSVWATIQHPAFFIALGIVILNWLIWTLSSGFWNSLWDSQSRFWSINIGLWLILILTLVKKEDGKGVHPTARLISQALAIFLIAIVLHEIYLHHKREGFSRKEYERRMVMEAPMHKNVVLRAICIAESGCKQFNPDGTVKRGEIDPDDIGKFQINKRIHADLIKKTGLNPEKEADNIQLASILYDKYGTAPWNKSRRRWARELEKLSPRLAQPFVLAILESYTDKWSEEVFNPLLPRTNIVWGRLDRSKGGKCEVMLDRDPSKIFPITETHNEFSPETIQFKCTEPSAQMRVRVVPAI